MGADVLRAAIDDTMMAPRPSWAYMAAILRRCDLEGIKTITDWRTSKERFQAAKNPALNYEQRTYTEDMFGEDFFIDLDKYGDGGDQA
jgi:DNA replication protein DnaD